MSRNPQGDAEGASADVSSRNAGIMPMLRDRWSQLGSVQRLRAKQLGSVAAVGLVGMALYMASSRHHAQAPTANPPTKLDMGAGLRGDSLEEKLRGDLKKISDDQSMMGQRISAIEEGKIVIGSKPPGGETSTSADAEGAPLPPALPGSADYPPSPTASSGADSGQLPAPPSEPPVLPAPPAPPVEKIVGSIGDASTPVAASAGDAGSADSKKKSRTIYLPPGFMKARLLTGIDALASRDATSNPEPIIARVQAPAVLPNDLKANLSGCFIIGNATGSLAKERVEVQLVSLSCVDFDQRSVVDQPVKGFFVDADGKKGLSGQVITRAGATLARAFLAGTISGIGQSVQDTFGATSVSALGSVRTLSPTDSAKTGVAEGLSKSSDKLTDFYLDLAREAGPIVEVGAGKDVVVVIQEGVSLEIKSATGVKF
jgi:conjugal transfer pilus assembly protein TraB